MALHRRRAELVATLVETDEPQVLALKAGKTLLVALAVPGDAPQKSMFLATTVAQKDWDAYMSESVDLRYLFTYPLQRIRYTFDLKALRDRKVLMDPFEKEVPDAYLPQPRFFAENHTKDFDEEDFHASKEVLLVDGSWDMPEFGRFYQRYSDIYSFLVAVLNWKDKDVPAEVKRRVRDAFTSKPFQGGSSYLHFYQDLVENLRRNERLGLNEIQYASPGHVEVEGREDAFEDVQAVIRWFIDHRGEIQRANSKFKTFLSKQGLLRMPGENYPESDPYSKYIAAEAKALNEAMRGPDFKAIQELSRNNALVAAKIVLSFYRRVDDAAEFFAQGRVNFSG